MECAEETSCPKKERGVYSVRGSGWVAVPEERLHEIAELRKEFHDQELKKARQLALYRKIA
jgi:hypothetical protein